MQYGSGFDDWRNKKELDGASSTSSSSISLLELYLRVLHGPDASLRASSAQKIGNMGIKAQSAYLELIKALKDESYYVRCSVVHALPRLFNDLEPEEVRYALIELLEDESSDVRCSALEELEYLCMDRNEFIKDFAKVLKDKNPQVREAAGKCLKNYDEAAIEVLVEATKDRDPHVRQIAALTLAEILEKLESKKVRS